MTLRTIRRKRTRRSPEERRSQILAAALDLFAIRGYDDTGVGDIADRAGVATGTVYLYFPSKEHILMELHTQFHRGLEQILMDVGTHLVQQAERGVRVDHADALGIFVDKTAEYVSTQMLCCEVTTRYLPRLPEAAFAEDEALERLLVAMLRDGAARGLIETSDPEMAARVISATVTRTMADAVVRREDLGRLTAELKEFLSKGLAPRPRNVRHSGSSRRRSPE